MISSKTSLGIEITQDKVSFALLSRTRSGLKLLKSGIVELPTGCIVDGNVKDSAKLAKSLKKLMRANGIFNRQAHISLVANPHLLQIIELPLEMPGNLGNYIESEIKHSAILLGRTHQSDYCGLASKSQEGEKRVIVSAVEEKKLGNLIKALNLAKIEALSIEPSSIGWIRALYDKYVATKYNYNVLFAKLSGSTVTMCVFRKGVLDFIRSRQLPIGAEIEEYTEIFINQLRAIKQYYDVEVSSFKDEQWAAIVDIYSGHVKVGQITDYLNNRFETVHLCSTSDALEHLPVTCAKSVKDASICAVGLAMKQNPKSAMNIKFDLIPEAEREKKALRRWMFAAACFAVAILSAIVLMHDVMSYRLIQANSVISSVRSTIKVDEIANLLRSQKKIDAELSEIHNAAEFINSSLDKYESHDWPEILTALVSNSPGDLCIMDLRQIGDSTLVIHGKVMTHSSAHKFTARLDESSLFESAVVSQLSNDRTYEGLVDYTIDCVMKAKTDENKNI